MPREATKHFCRDHEVQEPQLKLPIISTVPISSAPLKRLCEWKDYQAGLTAPLSTVKWTSKTNSGNPELGQQCFSSYTRDPLLTEIPFQGCKDGLDRGAALRFLKLQWQQQLVTPQLSFPPTAHWGDNIWWLMLESVTEVITRQPTHSLHHLHDLFKEKPTQNHLQQPM